MSLVVGTNSYVTLDEATAYLGDRYGSIIWDKEPNQESALVTAARLLDSQMLWLGAKTDNSQPMKWPRTGFDAMDIDSSIVPQIVKDAQCELAFDIVEKGGVKPAFDASNDLKRIKADTVEIEYRSNGVIKPDPSRVPDHIKRMLHGLIESTRVVRLLRA